MLANERDALWGLTVTTIGHEKIEPFESYPTKGHADGYYFDLEKGRTLNEFQLLYNPEGEGVFHSASVKETTLRPGDMFLLFPGEWHSYHPIPKKGWESYWIGFRGHNMEDRVKAGFLSPQKPIYHIGYSAEIIGLYKQAYFWLNGDYSLRRVLPYANGHYLGKCVKHEFGDIGECVEYADPSGNRFNAKQPARGVLMFNHQDSEIKSKLWRVNDLEINVNGKKFDPNDDYADDYWLSVRCISDKQSVTETEEDDE